jgi:hypothetical protein
MQSQGINLVKLLLKLGKTARNLEIIKTGKCLFWDYFKQAWGSQDSAVDTATGYTLDGRGVRVSVPVGARFFSSPYHPDRF